MLFVAKVAVAPKLAKVALKPGPGCPFVQFAVVDQLRSFEPAPPNHVPLPFIPPPVPVTNVQVFVRFTLALSVQVTMTVFVELTGRLAGNVKVPTLPAALLLRLSEAVGTTTPLVNNLMLEPLTVVWR